jgi:hypothetical protein
MSDFKRLFACAVVLIAASLLTWAETGSRGADGEGVAGSAQAGEDQELQQGVLIGPSRVTLKGGETLEAIGVVVETERIRVILEEGVEIEFEPVLVESIVSLAEDETAGPGLPPDEDRVGGIRVRQRGSRVGGEDPPRPRRSEYPRPARPTVSLKFERWLPPNSFRPTRWREPLARATSFPEALPGLDEPITSLRMSYWVPRPTRWAPSIFPDTWRPTDGFSGSP